MKRKFTYFTGLLLSVSLLVSGCSLRGNTDANTSAQTQTEVSGTAAQGMQEADSSSAASTDIVSNTGNVTEAQPVAGNSDDATMLDVIIGAFMF